LSIQEILFGDPGPKIPPASPEQLDATETIVPTKQVEQGEPITLILNMQVPEEGDYLKVLFHTEQGSEWVIGKIKIICDVFFWVDEWSDGDNSVRQIKRLTDEWKVALSSEYIPPQKQALQKKKNTPQDPKLPTIGDTIWVDFCTSNEDQTHSLFSGIVKINQDKCWFVMFSFGEVHKIKKNSKWIKK